MAALVVVIITPSAFADTVSTDIDNTTYEIEYTSNNVIIKSVTAIATTSWQSLIFETDVSDTGGDVSITFERDFFDAKIGYSDDDFFVLSDADEIKFEETKNDESRILSFSISAGTEEIEIIGTTLVGYSFLIEQEQNAKADAEAKAQSDAESKAQSDAEAKAQSDAEAKAQSDAEAKAQSDAEEQKLEKLTNSCGDGTVYENGECVLSPIEKNGSNFRTGPLIYSIVIAMSLGIIITMILWGIGKKSHKVLSDDDS